MAIEQYMRDHPADFQGNQLIGNDTEYVRGVVRILEQRFGLCAKQGAPEDEVAVKNSNSFSEQYDILFSFNDVNYSGYTVTCRPARF